MVVDPVCGIHVDDKAAKPEQEYTVNIRARHSIFVRTIARRCLTLRPSSSRADPPETSRPAATSSTRRALLVFLRSRDKRSRLRRERCRYAPRCL